MDFPGLRDSTEAAQGRPVCGFEGKPLLEVLVFGFRKMARDLIVDVPIHLSRTQESPQLRQDGTQASHERFSEIFKKRSTMLVSDVNDVSRGLDASRLSKSALQNYWLSGGPYQARLGEPEGSALRTSILQRALRLNPARRRSSCSGERRT
jgi:hypothetical protein